MHRAKIVRLTKSEKKQPEENMKCKRVIFFFGWKEKYRKKKSYKSGCVKESDKPKRSWNEELMSNGKKAFNEHGLVICYHTLRWSIWILSRGK